MRYFECFQSIYAFYLKLELMVIIKYLKKEIESESFIFDDFGCQIVYITKIKIITN